MMKFIIMAAIILGACGSGTFLVEKSPYGEPGAITKKQAISALESLDFKIKSANWEVVETKVIREYDGKGLRQVEYQTWVKVFIQAGWFKVYCTQRKMYTSINSLTAKENWKFTKCKDSWILFKIDELKENLDYVLTTKRTVSWNKSRIYQVDN